MRGTSLWTEGSCATGKASSEKAKLGAAVHPPRDELEFDDLAFALAAAHQGVFEAIPAAIRHQL